MDDRTILESIYLSGRRKIIEDIENKKKEKLSDYFFNLSNTLLGSLVVGVILLVLGNGLDELNQWIVLSVFITGIASVIVLAKIAYNIIK